MSEYTVRLSAFGLPDEMLLGVQLPNQLSKQMKGEIWNKRTGKKYTENIAWIEDNTTYDEGYEKAFDRIVSIVKSDDVVRSYYESSRYVELQIWAWIDNDGERFSMHLEPGHLDFLNSLAAHIDVDVYYVT